MDNATRCRTHSQQAGQVLGLQQGIVQRERDRLLVSLPMAVARLLGVIEADNLTIAHTIVPYMLAKCQK